MTLQTVLRDGGCASIGLADGRRRLSGLQESCRSSRIATLMASQTRSIGVQSFQNGLAGQDLLARHSSRVGHAGAADGLHQSLPMRYQSRWAAHRGRSCTLSEEHLVASRDSRPLAFRHASIFGMRRSIDSKSCHELFLLSYSSRGSMYLTPFLMFATLMAETASCRSSP